MTLADCPAPRYPEFAVIGRSNVGKSSLINMITSRKDLALVSKQPGGYGSAVRGVYLMKDVGPLCSSESTVVNAVSVGV